MEYEPPLLHIHVGIIYMLGGWGVRVKNRARNRVGRRIRNRVRIRAIATVKVRDREWDYGWGNALG